MNYRNWKITGFIATIVIVVMIPLSLIVHSPDLSKVERTAEFVGGNSCMECHQLEYDLWKNSHHDLAMDYATDSTVLGDFNNTTFERFGVVSRFYKKENKFYVYTEGPEGEMDEFEITHTFGYTPLQQYLVPFENGRFQCLPIAWDTEKNEWFYLPPPGLENEKVDPNDWLYWTNNGQNWNGMCAECHSTNLMKNYNPVTKVFNTTFSEIDVNCESCHGPGSLHLEWAELPEMARSYDNNLDLIVKTSGINNKEFVDLCAYCHSRRSSLSHIDYTQNDLMDLIIPRVLDENYFPDGQILEEDYVYGSFIQSKMYDKDVTCSDCHDAHSVKLKFDGNDLCAQCHQPDVYDVYDHHFHKYEGDMGAPIIYEDRRIEVGEGAKCINCHMDGRYYMVNDYRNDHSFRVPRPDLTMETGSPNACNSCHPDQTASWSKEYIKEWYGIKKKTHFGTAFAKGRTGDESSKQEIIKIIKNELYPAIVRATAIGLLQNFPDDSTRKVIKEGINDSEPIVRYNALRAYNASTIEELMELFPFLDDPVKAVRMEAAIKLSVLPSDRIPQHRKTLLNRILEEYRVSQEYSADFAAGRFNLGNLYQNLGDLDEAILQYEEALAIDSLFYPVKVNLAMVYNRKSDNNKTEALFRNLIKNHPEFPDAYYSLGLLLAETEKYEEAAELLKRATQLMPSRARIYYNLGLIYQYLSKLNLAEEELIKAINIEPKNLDFNVALADHYIKMEEFDKARKRAELIKKYYPSNPIGDNILNHLQQITK
ncbi:tetratricopeptide repeat protein [Bacteroidota bacterium]